MICWIISSAFRILSHSRKYKSCCFVSANAVLFGCRSRYLDFPLMKQSFEKSSPSIENIKLCSNRIKPIFLVDCTKYSAFKKWWIRLSHTQFLLLSSCCVQVSPSGTMVRTKLTLIFFVTKSIQKKLDWERIRGIFALMEFCLD